jgi:toxin ParE1/3/4
MSKARLTAQAREDLQSIRRYFAPRNARAGKALNSELQAMIKLLARQPGMGRDRSDIKPNLRCFHHRGYLIFYFPDDTGIQVVHILHTARDLSSIDFQDQE